MSRLFDRVRKTATGNTSSNINIPKKDTKELPQTWLQRLKEESEPVTEDGSDKFFGAENFGNTCYFNSVLQCLYYSVPLREIVLNYPNRSPIESILNDAEGKPRVQPTPASEQNGQANTSPARKPTPVQTSARTAAVPTNPNKPEDKESPEYKKKQAIMNGPVLSLDYDNSKTYGMEPSLFTCLKDMFEAVIAHSSRTGVFSPRLFLKMLQDQNEMFRGAMHQDAHEFLNFVLNGVVDTMEEHTRQLELTQTEETGHPANGISNSAKAPKYNIPELKGMSTQINDLFKGLSTSETKCLTCENVSQKDEPFLELTLDIENHCSVTSCLRKYSEEEMLCERNKFFCDKCGGLQEAEKRMKLKRLPKVLAMHLKRFQYNEDYTRLQKLFHRVVYPYHLRLFNTTDDVDDPDRIYELYAVVVHIGSGPHHGHYVSIIKTPDRGWLLFDDEMVEPVDKSFVRNFFGAQIGMACAYVLFYQETTLEKVKKEQESEGMEAAAAAMAAETSLNGKDTSGLGIKTNGLSSGQQPLGAVDAEDHYNNLLVHANTAPTPLSPLNTPALSTPQVARTPISPNVPGTPGLDKAPLSAKPDKKAEKKELAAKEKERKAAEKAEQKANKEELKAKEKEEKARKKSMEPKSKESAKAQKDARQSISMRRKTNDNLVTPEPGTLERPANGEVPVAGGGPAAVAAVTSIPVINKVTSPTSPAGNRPSSDVTTTPQPQTQPPDTPTKHTHAASFSGGLSRFRPSSKSVSMRKGKFWGIGNRDSKDFSRLSEDVAVYDHDGDGDEPDRGSEKPFGGVQRASTVAVPSSSATSYTTAVAEGEKDAGKENEKEKENKPGVLSHGSMKKSRGFSLRKKASALLS